MRTQTAKTERGMPGIRANFEIASSDVSVIVLSSNTAFTGRFDLSEGSAASLFVPSAGVVGVQHPQDELGAVSRWRLDHGWNLRAAKEMLQRVVEENRDHVRDPRAEPALLALLDRVERIASTHDLRGLPEPRIDVNLEATVDLIWVDRKRTRLLAIGAIAEPEAPVRTWLQSVEAEGTANVYDPTDDSIADYLRKFCRVPNLLFDLLA